MKCQNCGYNNREDAQYCNRCGSKLIGINGDRVQYYNNKEDYTHPLSNPKNRLLMILIVLLAAAGIAGGAFYYTHNSTSKYNSILSKAKEYARNEQYDEAIEQYKKAIDIDDSKEEPYLALADLYYHTEDFSSEITLLEKAKSKFKDDEIDQKYHIVKAVNDIVSSDSSDFIDSGKDGDLYWSIDQDGLLTVAGIGDYEGYEDSYINEIYPEWSNLGWNLDSSGDEHYCNVNIKEARFFVSNITSCKNLLDDCRLLSKVDLEYLDTSKATNMEDMFDFCECLKSIDVSHFNTSNVSNMAGMFHGCSTLKSLDLSSFDVSNVINMRDMFSCCTELESINLSSFHTTKVENMSYIFYNCESLETVDLSNCKADQLTDLSGMFEDCENLKSVNLSNFNTANVTDMSRMFNECESLESIDLSSFDTSNVQDMSDMFNDCSSLEKLKIHFVINEDCDASSLLFNCDQLDTDHLDIDGDW